MSKEKPAEGVRIELGGRSVLEVSELRLKSGETIVFPRIPGFGKHLSIYFPSGTKVAHHVTHQYPGGRKRRTRRKESDLGKAYRDFLAAIAPKDNPPPRASIHSTAAHRQWKAWFARVLPRVIRSPTDRPIWGLRGVMKDFSDRVISSVNATGLQVLPIDGVMALAQSSHPKVEDLFVRMTEADLSMAGTRVGFSDDFTRAVILVDGAHLIEIRVEDSEKAEETYFEAFGIRDFLDVFRLSEVGRRVLAEMREVHPEGTAQP